MGINHGGAHILMAEEFFDRTDVLGPFQQVCGKRMAERMAAGCFGYQSLSHRLFHGFLHDARIQMMTPLLRPGFSIMSALLLGKHPPPGPFPIGIRVLPGEVRLMYAPNLQQMLSQIRDQALG